MDLTLAKSSRAERHAAAMREAIALLKAEGVRFNQPDKYTLIFGPYSYWPGTGKLYRDGDEHSLRDQGPAEITALIRSLKPSVHRFATLRTQR